MNKILSGFCALALLFGITAACNRTETERVGSTPDRTTPSASPGTTTAPGKSSTTTTTSPSGSSSTTTTSPSGTTGAGSSSTTTTTTPGSSSTK